jgi:type II secretory pathway component HofQ
MKTGVGKNEKEAGKKMKRYFPYIGIVTICTLLLASATYAEMEGRTGIIEYYEVHNANIHSVCKQLSAFSGIDIIASEKIKAKISLTVSHKTWKQILQIICRIHNIAAMPEEGYIYLLSGEEQSKRIVDNAANFQASQELGPLHREIIKINNIPAADVQKSIQNLISARGKLTVVEHTNALIVYDTKENIKQIKQMITQLDIETAQINISCKIIEVSSGVVQRMGVHFGYSDEQDGVDASHMPQPGASGGGLAAGALEKITYGILNQQNFTAALEYLYGDNKGEVVAQPQITTVDNKEAKIFMGQQIPVKYLDEAGNTVVQMINAGTELIVKPHISGEGRILLELSPKKESYSPQADGTPVINEQSATTNVVVNNGETVVIAGLTSNQVTEAESGIPILKDIPLLGNLFKKSDKNHEKKDLIIFVTPFIINTHMTASAANVPEELPAEYGE